MDPTFVAIAGIIVLLALLAIGMHVAFALLLVGFVGYYAIDGQPALFVLGHTPFTSMAVYVFVLIPLFLVMGQLASTGGLAQDLFRAAYCWVGRFPGGLSLAAITSCAGFGALSASSVGTVAAIGPIAVQEMRRYNYDERLSLGTVAASGTIAYLIPPSGVLVLYGIITETNIGALLIAGIVPGIISAGMYMAMVFFRVSRNPSLGPPAESVTWNERFVSLRGIWLVTLLIATVLGGLFAGVWTVTEAAGMGALGTLLIAVGRRKLGVAGLISALKSSVLTSCMIFTIMMSAFIFGFFLSVSRVPFAFTDFLGGLPLPAIAILMLLALMYIVLGTFLDAGAMLLITIPIVFPLILDLGYDPIWFGIIVVKFMEVALITPPLGLNVYVLAGVSEKSPIEVFRGVFPFFLMDVLTLAILISFPQLTLWLPGRMLG